MTQKVWIDYKMGIFTARSANVFDEPNLKILAIFLTDMGDLETNIEDFNNSNLGYVIGNQTSAESIGDKILIEYQYSEQPWTYTLEKNQFLEILELWLKIFKIKPARIDITQEDNRFTFEFDTAEGDKKIVIE